jgi:hypothetical protein
MVLTSTTLLIEVHMRTSMMMYWLSLCRSQLRTTSTSFLLELDDRLIFLYYFLSVSSTVLQVARFVFSPQSTEQILQPIKQQNLCCQRMASYRNLTIGIYSKSWTLSSGGVNITNLSRKAQMEWETNTVKPKYMPYSIQLHIRRYVYNPQTAKELHLWS